MACNYFKGNCKRGVENKRRGFAGEILGGCMKQMNTFLGCLVWTVIMTQICDFLKRHCRQKIVFFCVIFFLRLKRNLITKELYSTARTKQWEKPHNPNLFMYPRPRWLCFMLILYLVVVVVAQMRREREGGIFQRRKKSLKQENWKNNISKRRSYLYNNNKYQKFIFQLIGNEVNTFYEKSHYGCKTPSGGRSRSHGGIFPIIQTKLKQCFLLPIVNCCFNKL